jgi:ferritin-like metal-binding protein YciE
MEKKAPSSKKQTTASKSNQEKSSNKPAGKKSPVSDSLLEEFFHDELKDIYWAEQHLVKTLPKMKQAASTQELQDAFEEHLQVTKTHVERLEQVFEMLGHKAQGKKCDAMDGLTKEGESIIEDTEEGTATRDVGLIMAAQKVEHYEIATYGGLTTLAKTMGRDDIASILHTTLEEEKAADLGLTEIAENDINYQAAEEVES